MIFLYSFQRFLNSYQESYKILPRQKFKVYIVYTIQMRVSNEFDFFQQRKRKIKKPPTNEMNQSKKTTSPQNTNKISSYSMGFEKYQSDEQSTAGTLQNGQITEFYFQKLIHIEYQLCLVVFLNLFLIAVSSMISFPQLKDFDAMTQKGCLYFCLICVIIECLLLGFRTVTVLQLQKEQKILYEKSTIFSTKKIFEYFAECSIMLIQPYPFFSSINILTTNSYDLVQFQLPVNDILTVVSVLRIYVFIRAGLILMPYQNTRCTNFYKKANRLCKMYGCKANFSFSLKCMFKDNPLMLIGIFFTISSIIFAFQIYLVERRAAHLSDNPKGMCNNFTNALWLVLMTITTVGYGDYFPHTFIGRIIILIVAIWGTFIVSMMVVVVSNTLQMQKNEKRTSIIINKLQLRRQIQKQAQKFVGYFMLSKRHQKLKKDLQNKLKSAEETFEKKKLKKQIKFQEKSFENYNTLCNYAQKRFSKLRRQVKGSQDIDDIEDEVSSHFLHVNSDIQILNKNQQKIINFIHQYLEYNGKNKKQNDKGKIGTKTIFNDQSHQEDQNLADLSDQSDRIQSNNDFKPQQK